MVNGLPVYRNCLSIAGKKESPSSRAPHSEHLDSRRRGAAEINSCSTLAPANSPTYYRGENAANLLILLTRVTCSSEMGFDAWHLNPSGHTSSPLLNGSICY